jgi:predicted SnoaL-like aldol condensation-catalyzing enzyme
VGIARTVDLPDPIKRLADALNAHDPAQVAAAFTDDYRCEVPMHPERGFTGNEQVRQNYTDIFARMPDLRAEVLRWIGDGDEIWSEWEMTGSGPGGSTATLRGVVIADAPGSGPIAHTRFYIEPVNP